jgi:hypothetical protein
MYPEITWVFKVLHNSNGVLYRGRLSLAFTAIWPTCPRIKPYLDIPPLWQRSPPEVKCG